MKRTWLTLGAVAVLLVLAVVAALNRSAPPKPVASNAPGAEPAASQALPPTPLPPEGEPPRVNEEAQPANPSPPADALAAEPAKAAGKSAPPTPKPNPPARTGKPPIQDPTARAALVFVGLDPVAEAYWYEAINDPTLSAHERQDLIEDLNEEGFSDPKHPTLEDLPLILNRISLIEAVGPDAMDQVNADAFQEAYKDLVNLADLTVGRGEPVK